MCNFRYLEALGALLKTDSESASMSDIDDDFGGDGRDSFNEPIDGDDFYGDSFGDDNDDAFGGDDAFSVPTKVRQQRTVLYFR